MASTGFEIRDVVPGLWIWRLQHPAWHESLDWEPLVTSTVVESGEEVALIDPLAPPRDAIEIWDRLDAKPPTMAVILKPDHVRDVDLFARRYEIRGFGPYLYWSGDAPETELEGLEPERELPGGLVTLYDGSLHTVDCANPNACWASGASGRAAYLVR